MVTINDYDQYKQQFDALEKMMITDLDNALEKMIVLYIAIHKTLFRDISDKINVMVFEKGTLQTKTFLEKKLTAPESDFLKELYQAWVDVIGSRC